jgi:hypothetical protein
VSATAARALVPRPEPPYPATPRPTSSRLTTSGQRVPRPNANRSATSRANASRANVDRASNVQQSALFEAEPYRVARQRAGAVRVPSLPAPAPRGPAPIARSALPRATVNAMAAPDYSRSLVPFVAMCVVIVVGSLVAVLLLNTTMTQRAYETRDLRTQLSQFQDQRSELLATLEQDASPQALAQAAQALGMVPAPRVGFVTIQSGSVIAPGATS